MGLLDMLRSLFGIKEETQKPAEAVEKARETLREATASPFEQETVEEVGRPAAEQGGALVETVVAALGGLEKLAKKIPGYKGYKEKEVRREADKLLRLQVAQGLDDQRKRLSELQVQLLNQGQIGFVDDLERAVMKLQLLTDRVKTASYGYAGLFDAVKIKEEQLDALYDFDNKMLDYVDDVAGSIDQVSSAITAREGIGEAIGGLVGTTEEANLSFGHREEAILKSVG